MKKTLFALLLLLPNTAHAELHECNGTWTNKPCDSQASKTIAAVDERNTPEDKDRSAKRSLLHELTMRAIKAREDYDVEVDLVTAQDRCLKPIYSIEQCQSIVGVINRQLDERLLIESKIASDKKSVELQEEANRLQRERNEIEENKANVAVVENRYYILPRRRYPRGPRYDNNGITQGGAAIQVQGQSASGNISGSVSVGGSSSTTVGTPFVNNSTVNAPTNANTWSDLNRSGRGSGMITDRPSNRRLEKGH